MKGAPISVSNQGGIFPSASFSFLKLDQQHEGLSWVRRKVRVQTLRHGRVQRVPATPKRTPPSRDDARATSVYKVLRPGDALLA